MRESLRLRLIAWYAGVLALVIALFGTVVAYRAWRSAIAALDQELAVHARLVASSIVPAGAGRFDVNLPAEAIEYFRQEDRRPYYIIWDSRGALVDGSDDVAGTGPPSSPGGRTVDGRREVTVTAESGAIVLVGRDLSADRSAAWSLAASMAFAGLVALAVAIGGGWFVAGRALAPIERISRVAREMVAGDLAARIPVERTESELEQVASALNEAFDRLRLALDQQRRFTADASHELRTPVTVMRAELEWALRRERGSAEYQQSLEVCQRALARIEETVEALLRTAREHAEATPDRREPIRVERLATEVTASLGPLAQERGVSIEVKGVDFAVVADRTLLREALSNLVANAVQYNRRGGRVTIDLRCEGPEGRIEVSDTGIGIPAWAVPRVFDRFFRVDEARARESGGAGLGLAVAQAIVTAHGGTLSCTSREGIGSQFVVAMPAHM